MSSARVYTNAHTHVHHGDALVPGTSENTMPAVAPPSDVLAEIRADNDAFLAFPRHNGDGFEILCRKLEASYRRRATLRRVLDEAEGGSLDPTTLAEAVIALNLTLDEAQRSRLEGLIADREVLARVLAHQGIRLPDVPRYHTLAGPDVDLDIRVNRDSPWPFERWREIAELSEYETSGDGVFFRGVHLRPGDLIFPNVNLAGNIVYSALTDPAALYSHSAIVAVLEHGGRRFPAVIETYEKGVRAIPLNVFFHTNYTSYAEIYRHRGMDQERRRHVTPRALEAIEEVRGYNFDTCDTDREYVCCTMFASWIYEAAGLPPVPPRSKVGDPTILANLARLEYTDLDLFFTPVDFVRNPDFDLVGVVDNNQFDRILTRELLQVRFREIYSSKVMDLRRLPFMYYPNLWAVRQIRARTALGWVLSKIFGFDPANLPKGPERLLALIQPTEAQLTRMSNKLVPVVRARIEELDDFNFRGVIADTGLEAEFRRVMRFRWLREDA
jgi:Permuted papain-like amidase enzyme, YaeF/YiiX, C92 family